MKKMLHKMALVWISALTIMGLAKAKEEKKAENQEKRQNMQSHDVILDEFELSAFHSN